MDGLIFTYLILFPFGKLLGVIPDALILVICILSFRKRPMVPNFIVICIFSLLFSLSIFKLSEIFTGLLYLIRFASYLFFSKIIAKKYGKKKNKRELIVNSLMVVGVCVAIFGWVQYFVFPDLTILKTLGWDDHYFRLVSTFLDPAFTGIILVLTEILILARTVKKRTNMLSFLNIFLITTIAFTYSRSSYLALIFSLLLLIYKFRAKFVIFLLIFFVALIPILPKPAGEGVNLKRTYSINEKFKNYNDSIILFSKSPIFGIGFDNVCIARQKFLGDKNANSHACSGLDNSLFFVLVTTGIVGLIAFFAFVYKIVKNTTADSFGLVLKVSLLAVLIHGMFTNTFFYSFVMGWVAILIGISRRTVSDL